MAGQIKFLKPDLKLAIDRVQASPGDVLVVRPKDRFSRFTEEYLQWLQENLYEVMPPGVRALILTDDTTEFVRLTPESQEGVGEEYAEGWRAAFDALERFYTRSESDE